MGIGSLVDRRARIVAAPCGLVQPRPCPQNARHGRLAMRIPKTSFLVVSLLAFGFWLESVAAQGPGNGQLAIAFDASIAPTFLDPAETPGIGTPFVFLYALHDALVKPLPGNNMAPCLAESWKESPDGLGY